MHNNIHCAHAAQRCGALTRRGTACQTPAIRGKRRCRMHGGYLRGGPIGNQHALKHGRYAARTLKERRLARQLLREMRTLLRQLKTEE